MLRFLLVAFISLLILQSCKHDGGELLPLISEATQLLETQPDSALILSEQALKIAPDNIAALNCKATALVKLNQCQLAIENISRLSQSKQFIPSHNILIGLISEDCGKIEESHHYYHKALSYYENTEAWKLEPKVNWVDYAFLTTILNGKEDGEKKLEELYSTIHLNELEKSFIERYHQLIQNYSNGGYREFLTSL